MPCKKFEDAEAIDNERRKAIAKSIRIISVEELKRLGDEIFDEPDRPWRQTFLSVVTENPGATFYHASAGEGVIFLYSRDNDKGLWYLPGSGIGPLSDGGDRKSTRLNSSHANISYAVFCLKKKKLNLRKRYVAGAIMQDVTHGLH